jgi:transposase
VTQDDVLFGYRLQLFAIAAERGVSQACRLMGVHRSSYYRWKLQVEQSGLEMLRPRERRRPVMPNQLSVLVEQRIVAFSLGHPDLGPRRIASRLARAQWGGLVVSPNGVYKTLVRHGLNTRARRLALGRRLPRPVRAAPRSATGGAHRHQSSGRIGRHRLLLRWPLHGARGPVRQITAIDTYSSYAWADHVTTGPKGPNTAQTSALAQRIADELQQAGWRLERVLSDNGTEFGRREFAALLPAGTRHSQIRSGRPQTNGHVERLHRTILEACWRPAFARYLQIRLGGLRRDLAHYLNDYNHHRQHHGRITAGRRPADLVYGARKMEPK